MTIAQFPKDFASREHMCKRVMGADGTHWTLRNEAGDDIVSIVGGVPESGLYGDGVTTFEMWDFAYGEPRGGMTIPQINEHLLVRGYHVPGTAPETDRAAETELSMVRKMIDLRERLYELQQTVEFMRGTVDAMANEMIEQLKQRKSIRAVSRE
jgi:hypothetical protein